MARIPEAELQHLKAAVSLVAVVQAQGRQLVKKGKDFTTLCPFHDEKTPSCVISPEKNLYHCFGCNAGGSVLDWVMQTEKLSLRKAAERLKAELGDNPAVVPLVAKDEPEIFAEDEAGRQQLLSRVVEFYHHTLLNAPEAVAYLEKRRLDVVLNRLADYTEQRQRLKSRLLQAMLYPLVLLVVATGVVTILLTAVVPKIIEQFDHLGHALPASTRMLIAMSDALQTSGVYWLVGLLGLLVLGQRLLKSPAMRLRWDKTLLRLPVTGRVARGLNTARFSRTLSILTASSVPLLEGIQTAAAVSANRYVEQQLLLAADRVREGSSLRAALAELRLFPPMMLYMIASGEQSGELETMLEQAAVNQEREFDTQVGLALGLFEPALVVMMAGVVLFIVIAILEPMLQLNNMVGM